MFTSEVGIAIFRFGLVYGVWRHIQQYFSYIVVVSFIGGGIFIMYLMWYVLKKSPFTITSVV
jgi:hypothetical protein